MAKNSKAPLVRLETPPFIVMFPNFFTARKSDLADDPNAPAKFGCTAVFDSKNWTEAHKGRMRAILAALEDRSQSAHKRPWKDVLDSKGEIVTPGLNALKRGLRRNDSRTGDSGPFDFVDGKTLFANLTSIQKPGVIDVNGDEITQALGNTDLIYQGCIAKAIVHVFDYDNKSKGVALGINNLQVLVSDPKVAPRRDNKRTAAEDFNESDESAFLSAFIGDEDEPAADEDDDF